MDLSITSITATSAQANFSGLTGGHSVQLQYSTRPTFDLGVSPIITLTAVNPASLALEGLNQNARYYVRAREYLLADGTEQPWSAVAGFATPLDTAPDTSVASITHDPAMIVLPAAVIAWAAGNEIAGFPVENLGFDGPVAWRSKGSPHSFTAQMAAETIDTIALMMSNASEGATVTVKAGNSQAEAESGAPAFSHGPVPFRASENLPGRPGYHALIQLPAAQKYPFWQVVITDTLTDDTLHLEHAVFGFNRATKKHAIDKTEEPLDLGTVERNRGGIPARSYGMRMRRVNFELGAVLEESFETLYAEIGWRVGLTDPILVVPNPKAGVFRHDRMLYGTLTASMATNNRAHLFSRRFTIESII